MRGLEYILPNEVTSEKINELGMIEYILPHEVTPEQIFDNPDDPAAISPKQAVIAFTLVCT